MTVSLSLSPTARRAFDRLAADCRRVLEARFVALVATTPTASVAFSSALTVADLEAFSALAEAWHHDGLDTPLLLTPDEFHRSLDAFPLEYQSIVDRHAVITGTPPFDQIVVDPQHLRRACEVQAKSHLIHLRQGWVNAEGHEDRLAALVAGSAPSLRALLANVARLNGASGDDQHAAIAGARHAGLDEGLMHEVLGLEVAPERAHAVARRLPDYLDASERLWAFVDRWSR